MSPRKPDTLHPEVAARLAEARRRHDDVIKEADDLFRTAVVGSLRHGSVRQVAKAAGLSPTTVHAWSKEQG